MERYILRFAGAQAPAEQVSRIRKLCKVVDESAKMLLVECEKQELGNLMSDLPGWKMSPEVHMTYPERPLSVKDPIH